LIWKSYVKEGKEPWRALLQKHSLGSSKGKKESFYLFLFGMAGRTFHIFHHFLLRGPAFRESFFIKGRGNLNKEKPSGEIISYAGRPDRSNLPIFGRGGEGRKMRLLGDPASLRREGFYSFLGGGES